MEKTAVLLITTHGWYNIDSKDKPDQFRVPDNMNIITYTNARKGECNFLKERELNQYLSYIVPSMPLLNTSDSETILNTMNYLHNRFQGINEEISSNIRISSKRKHRELDEDELDFIRNVQYRNGISPISVKLAGEYMNNKNYEFKILNGSDYDFKIIQIDNDGKIMDNIGKNVIGLKYITRNTQREQKTNLSDIVDYLKEHEYTKVVIFDFSCEIINRNDKDVSRRTMRQVRRKNMNAGKRKRIMNKTVRKKKNYRM